VIVETYVEETKVLKISRHSSPLQIIADRNWGIKAV
jgi:hypothetical protein